MNTDAAARSPRPTVSARGAQNAPGYNSTPVDADTIPYRALTPAS